MNCFESESLASRRIKAGGRTTSQLAKIDAELVPVEIVVFPVINQDRGLIMRFARGSH